jgi:Flp pilus assembly pilin Flp
MCRKEKRIGFTVMSPDIIERRISMFTRLQRGASMVEWIVLVLVVVGVLALAVGTITTAVSSAADRAGADIDAINP